MVANLADECRHSCFKQLKMEHLGANGAAVCFLEKSTVCSLSCALDFREFRSMSFRTPWLRSSVTLWFTRLTMLCWHRATTVVFAVKKPLCCHVCSS